MISVAGSLSSAHDEAAGDSAGAAPAGEGEGSRAEGSRASPSWSLMEALLVVRHARHVVGSPTSDLFRLAAELSAGARYAARAEQGDAAQFRNGSNGRIASRVRSAGDRDYGWSADSLIGTSAGVGTAPLTRMWSVDVPLAAGSTGLLGANLGPSVEVNLSSSSPGSQAWDESLWLGSRLKAKAREALEVRLASAVKACDGDRASGEVSIRIGVCVMLE